MNHPPSARRLLASLVLVTACATAPELQPESPGDAEPPGDGLATSDFLADPVFTPPAARADARTGAATGAAISGSADQARQLALRIVDALRRSDAAAIEHAFADPVLRVRAGRYMLRRRLAERCLRAVAPLGWHADSEAAQVVDTEHIEVEALRGRGDSQSLPPGLLARDVRVRVPIRRGTRKRQTTLPCLSHIYVRTGASPTVVAID